MRSPKSSGHTLVELLTTMVIGAMVVAMAYSVYLMTLRFWAGYTARIQNASDLHLLRERITRTVEKGTGVSAPDPDRMLVTMGDSGVVSVARSGDSLCVDGRAVSRRGVVDSFAVQDVPESPGAAVECVLALRSENAASVVRWRAVCMSPELPRSIPVPRDGPDPAQEYYWEK